MSVLLLLLVGCPVPTDKLADTAPVGCLDVDATVMAGSSDFDDLDRPIWVEMPEGSEQIMVHGPQGGWHILGAADVRHAGQIVGLQYAITWPARDVRLSYGNFKVMLVPHDDGCGGTYAGMLGVLDVADVKSGDADTPPELLAGETLLVTMDAEDLSGRTAHHELSVIAALDPADKDTAEAR
ncbi:MAG: hypothetical protein EXR71_12290 [Myxococcales bacterium]|nr:hypothetical protein [Myxococcales bacterium]